MAKHKCQYGELEKPYTDVKGIKRICKKRPQSDKMVKNNKSVIRRNIKLLKGEYKDDLKDLASGKWPRKAFVGRSRESTKKALTMDYKRRLKAHQARLK